MISKSYAKVNIFLKISGRKDNYHTIVSRFVRVKNLFDLISFEKCTCNSFTLEGDFGCKLENNTIYKAYGKLYKLFKNVRDYFKYHKVVVKKNIPEFAGLGGGSSNCATFMIMVNEVCNLNLSKDELAKIGATVGADVPFFIYEVEAANVTGIGEVVEKFDEEPLDIEVITPEIKCDTGAIFSSFRDIYYKEISSQEATRLLNMKSKEILKNMGIDEANDLYLPASDCYPKLKEYAKDKWYFSGSGSSFFRVKNS
jgi:4-diphosphocytidyl-2-C-methyl-D-erythritol kinase